MLVWNAQRRSSFVRGLAAALVWLVIVASDTRAVFAHAGHDHGPQIEVSASVAPRLEASSDDFELLAVLKGADLIVTIDRFRTNEPIVEAKISATVNGEAADVTPVGDGTFKLASPKLMVPGRAEVVFIVDAVGINDLLAGALEIPSAAATPVRAAVWWQRLPLRQDTLIGTIGGFLAGVLLVLLFRRRPAAAAVVALVCSTALIADARPVNAAEGNRTITITADLPQRLPDGTLFVPKVTQRLLSIRTVMAGESTAGSTLELNGQIIADPAGFGRVQATVDGRVDAPPSGLVVAGQKVKRGQALAVLTPIVATADRSSFESAVGEIDTRIALAEAKLTRLTRIAGVVAQKDIDDTRTELETLKTRRTAVRGVVRETVTLAAPIDGIVSMSAAVPGQVATAREALFEIVDPAKLWVEAIAFDTRHAADITAARAIDPNGAVLALDFVGRGISARQQGLPLNFSIKSPPASLVLGTPVNVLVTTREVRQGLILPQSAVVKGQNGLSIVWTHTQAERFKPNIVKVKPIDGQRLLVDGGLAANERVVIEGATLLNQVR